jgi:outer membrane protein TolC
MFIKRFIISLIFFIASASGVFSQEKIVTDSVSLFIPPLNVILDSAINHSPLLKIKALDITIANNEIKIEKKKWLNYIFLEGATNYGLFDQIVISNLNNHETSSIGILSKSQQIRYYGGIGTKIPLSIIGNRQKELKIRKINVQQANLQLEDAQSSLIQLVIDEYYTLLYHEESVKTFTTIYNTLEISYLKAERDVSNGQMGLNDFAMLTSILGKAKDDCAKAKNNFFSQYRRLEEITGISFKLVNFSK